MKTRTNSDCRLPIADPPRPEITLAATSKRDLARMLDGMIHSEVFALLWSVRRCESARARLAVAYWAWLPFHIYGPMLESRDETKSLFAALKRSLAPTDYRAALAVARDIANQQHRQWAERDQEKEAA